MSNENYIVGIDYPQPFDEYAVELCASAGRSIAILSPALDYRVFDSDELAEALSALVRSSSQTEVRILVSDKRQMVSRGHRLLSLARRLPSSVQLKLLREHPEWNGETFIVRDRNGVLYRPSATDDRSFYEPESRASAERYLGLFEDFWQLSTEDPDLRTLRL